MKGSNLRLTGSSRLQKHLLPTWISRPPVTHDRRVQNCTMYNVYYTQYNSFSFLPLPGVGCFGAASIYISQHIPSRMFTVLRLIDLEILSSCQLEDVQDEMKISQLLNHCNLAKYLCCFVVGSKLWAMQPLMHYGMLV